MCRKNIRAVVGTLKTSSHISLIQAQATEVRILQKNILENITKNITNIIY